MLTGQITRRVPSLRRYAGCLTGSAARGDALVFSTLAAVLGGRVEFRLVAGPRLALLRALHEMWDPAEDPRGCDLPGSAVRLLQLLAPLARAAVMLTRLEGLTTVEAGFVLRIEAREVQYRLQQAERELAKVLARRVLIVEDDAFTALELEDLVTALGHSAIGPAMTRDEAVSLAMQEEPDLILSDVQLDERHAGISAMEEIRYRMNVPVIFVTAYPANFADRVILDNSYVVPKPFSDGAMMSAITHALRFSPSGR